MEFDKKEIGLRIQTRRTKEGFSLVQWAEKLALSKSTISRYESGTNLPDAEFLVKLWLHHGVDPIRLLTGDYDTVDTTKKGFSPSEPEKAHIEALRACSPAERSTVEQVLALALFKAKAATPKPAAKPPAKRKPKTPKAKA